MALNITFDDPGNPFAIYYTELTGALNTAWSDWTQSFTRNASIEIRIAFSEIGGLAEGGAAIIIQTQVQGGFNIFQTGVLFEFATGVDLNGAAADASITVRTSAVGQLAFGPAPTPASRIDAETLMRHELGHVLGIATTRDANDDLTGTAKTTFDKLVVEGANGALSFAGGNAFIVAQGAVALSDGAHLQSATDLMKATLANGEERPVGALDLAILADIGAPVAGVVPQTVALFDSAFYLAANPDVAAAGVDPRQHFDEFGWREQRDPNALFDTGFYLAQNPDVAAAGVNPLGHYLAFGGGEGRDPSAIFDSSLYLAANPDVAAAGVNPLQHFLDFGAAEGRLAPVTGLTAQGLATEPLGPVGLSPDGGADIWG